MRDYDQRQPPRVIHRPLAPPRKSIPGEGIYLALWQEWATARPRDWEAIFVTNGPVRQRAASVAASFMVFMGCGGGMSFTHEAEHLAKQSYFHSAENAYVAAWAMNNMRHGGINRGLRTIEYMLSSVHPINAGFGGRDVNWADVPRITQEDHDIIESMVRWWSTGPAGVVRSIADPMIKAANTKMLSRMFEPAESTS